MKLCPNEWKKLRTEDKMGTEDHLISVSALDKVTFYAVFELWQALGGIDFFNLARRDRCGV